MKISKATFLKGIYLFELKPTQTKKVLQSWQWVLIYTRSITLTGFQMLLMIRSF